MKMNLIEENQVSSFNDIFLIRKFFLDEDNIALLVFVPIFFWFNANPFSVFCVRFYFGIETLTRLVLKIQFQIQDKLQLPQFILYLN